MSRILNCRHDDTTAAAVGLAAAALQLGKLVVLPTDTVYGVGADAFNPAAVAALLAAKGRGPSMPPPVLVPSARTLDGLALELPTWVPELLQRYWPGPLTVVVRAQPSLRWDLGDTNGTVAVRMPDHPVALALLSQTGPLAVTSANRTGEPAATSATEAAEQLGDSVELYLDAGSSSGLAASTILDCTTAQPTILRAGPISGAELAETLGRPVEEASGQS